MAYDDIVLGTAANSKITEVMIRSATTGMGLTGLTNATVTAYYIREGMTAQAISVVAGTVGDAYSSGKFAEVSSANMPGLYQFHIPDAALATGKNVCTIVLESTGGIDVRLRILILSHDLRTSLPNAVPGAAGGVFIAGSNAATTLASMTVTAALTAATIVSTGTTTLNALTVTNATTLSGTTTYTGAVTYSSTISIPDMTVGNVYTFNKMMQIIAAGVAGDVSGTTPFAVKDIGDGTTTVYTIAASQTTPFKDVTIP